ncbi:LacI family transcriptional regulator [Salana multivorans]|uniref:LacI family transcriptional regulator n=1 Tax=Salana multivorans TaxID=120377 RepID=A0A3N2DAV7_9MICO|nr:LacI family DNA-binding transcriptional regulator [Salana multivorans]ROR96940.1 LacI family transcriptional regulator [Salana multivorans]
MTTKPERADRGVTLADIAREAGVSLATASRAMSGARGVSAATTRKVRAVAERHSYVVSPEASGLSRGSTGRIGVLTRHIARPFYAEALEEIESVLADHGLDTVVYCVRTPEDQHSFFERLPARRKVDGLLVLALPLSPHEKERLDLLDVAVVAASGQTADYPYVSIDDAEAGRQAMDHLLRLGHRRIAMIDAIDPNASEWPIELRSLAYTRSLEAAGIELEEDLFVRVPWGAEGGAEGMERLLSLREPPTAVFIHSDDLAYGALRVLRRAGLEVPRDMSVISIDDAPMSELLDLTTVRQDARLQGRLAAETLLAMLADEPYQRARLTPTRLVPRGSTAAPAR